MGFSAKDDFVYKKIYKVIKELKCMKAAVIAKEMYEMQVPFSCKRGFVNGIFS